MEYPENIGGFDAGSIPFVGPIIQAIQNQATAARDSLVRRVADFQLLQGKIARHAQTLDNAVRVRGAAVTLQQQARITAARAFVSETQARWNHVSEQLDMTLTAIKQLQQGNASVDKAWLAQQIATSAAGISLVTQMEQKCRGIVSSAVASLGLSPEEKTAVGTVATAGLSVGMLALGAGIAYIMFGRRRGRGR